MKAQELSNRYSTAIFTYALEDWLTTLTAVQSQIENDSKLLDELKNPNQTFQIRKVVLDGIIPSESSQPIRNFLYTMLNDDDMELLGEIVQNLQRMAEGGPQVQVGYVTTATILADEEKDGFRQKLQTKYGENLELVFHVDASIIGGAIIQVGDKLIDGSVASRLEAMGNALGVKA